jgi:Flp pilus assembly protein TadG
MKRRKLGGRGGNTILETAIFLPMLLVLLVAMEQIGKLTYTYYTIKKIEFTIARFLATQQGVNFCAGTGDPSIAAAINLGLTGTTDGTGAPFLTDLTADMIVITPEIVDSSGVSAVCTCDITGCDESVGGGSPAYITVGIPSGYPVAPIIPFTTTQTIPLVPEVKVPYEGT